MTDICAVILAGGSGTRLWPLSRSKHPKQFLRLHSQNTMLQETILRLSGLNIKNSVTVCNEEHRFLVAEQQREINRVGSIILEPLGKNTAPAIGLAALAQLESDPLLLILSADHVIDDEDLFTRAVTSAVPVAESGKLVTFGIVPKEPNVGYGYIKKGMASDGGFTVDSFVEKPSLDRAKKYLSSGDYFWNSGMFLFKASRYLEELEKFRPEIYKACKSSMLSLQLDLDFLRIDKYKFGACPAESIDYAVMENTDDAIVIPMNAGWSDIGSWSSLSDICKKDSSGNVAYGDTILHKTKNSYIRSEDKLVTTLGVNNLIVVSTKDAVLVASKDSVQDVKIIAQKLKDDARGEWELHREVYRPWGKYDSLDKGDGYQVKRITVKPGAKLSIQKHQHRAEHWVVVSGTALVTNGDKTFVLSKNESTFIPLGVVHALENTGEVELELIEVQSGNYLGEDDIIRLEDRYGRVTKY